MHECYFDNCERTFDKEWKLNEHIASHTGDRQYLCNEPGCEKSFLRKAHLTRHAATHSEERPYTCPTCASTFKLLPNLRKHERLHTGKKPYSCHIPECSSCFLKKTQLYAHLLSAHSVNTPFQCEECSACFTNKSHLNRHVKRKHLTSFMCTDCYVTFDKFSVLQKHIAKEHKKKPYCGECSMVFSNQGNLNAHLVRHHKPAEVAGSAVSSVEYNTEVISPEDLPGTKGEVLDPYVAVKVDEELQHQIFQVRRVCEPCGKEYSRQSQLSHHMRVVHNTIMVSEFKCSECSGIFKHKSNLVKHIQSKHKGVKRFSCDKCDKKFFYKQAFERHVRTIHERKNESKAPKRPWNKTSNIEDLSGHFEDERVKIYVNDMSERAIHQNTKRLKIKVEPGNSDS